MARIVRDVGVAEDLAQEALVAALQQWPESGVPDNPGAWLMAVGKRRAIDRLRRDDVHERKAQELGRELRPRQAEGVDSAAAIDDPFDDDLLRLVFTTCHPVLSTDARVALTLRLLGGLTTKEIARAYLVPEATVAQRIVRAKRTLSAARVPFEPPGRDELPERLASVLEVIYLIFNEGYAATGGDDWVRPELLEEALRLGRILAELLPVGAGGPWPRRVDGAAGVSRACAHRALGRADPAARPGSLPLGLAARRPRPRCARARAPHGRRRSGRTRSRRRSPPATRAPGRPTRPTGSGSSRSTTGSRSSSPSPVVELNRAVAVGMAFGPEPALELVDALGADPALRDYHALPTVRGDLLARLGRDEEARAEFERAAGLTQNTRERAVLLDRMAGRPGRNGS